MNTAQTIRRLIVDATEAEAIAPIAAYDFGTMPANLETLGHICAQLQITVEAHRHIRGMMDQEIVEKQLQLSKDCNELILKIKERNELIWRRCVSEIRSAF
jgi:hypothetical protein